MWNFAYWNFEKNQVQQKTKYQATLNRNSPGKSANRHSMIQVSETGNICIILNKLFKSGLSNLGNTDTCELQLSEFPIQLGVEVQKS